MKRTVPRRTAPRRIALLRALQLGDMLCVVPALRAVRAAVPHAEITLIGLPWASAFVQRFSAYLDHHMVLPGMLGLPEQAAAADALPSFIAATQQRRFDLVIQLHGSGILTNQLAMQLGAAHVAGFYLPGHDCPDATRFLPWVEQEHEVLRALRLMRFLGFAPQGDALEFPLTAADDAALQRCEAILPPPGSYACIHPGARLPSRRWPPQRFAEVADTLAQAGLHIVLTGTAQEAAVTQSVIAAMRAPAIDLTGQTGLGAFAALIAGARLVVCNDTGASHMAAALATPSVVICCGADPQRWAPLDHRRHRMVFHDVFCRPCMHVTCPIGHPCALGVGVETVVQQARQVLLENKRVEGGIVAARETGAAHLS